MDINYYRGLIITAPYGTYIRDNGKTLIVKSKKIPSITKKPLLLIENKMGLGIIELSTPKDMNLLQFEQLKRYHKITDTDRKEWWPNYKKLYAYIIMEKEFFKIPLLLYYTTGPQVTIQPKNVHVRKVYIGTAGLTGESFTSYAKKFRSLEVNYTFYKRPTESFAKNLAKYDLTYTIKVNKLITHYKQLKDISKVWKEFYSVFKSLGNKCVCFLFQFSPKFYYNENNYDKLVKMGRYVKGDGHIFSFEFRDRNWFCKKVYDLFEKNKWTMVITHVNNDSGWAGNLENGFNIELDKYRITSNAIYLRLHGTKAQYKGKYSEKFFDELVKYIRGKTMVKTVFVYFNNTDDGSALVDAKRLMGRFNEGNL
jgi:uncharacterized protein YecE (DUF72 family)